MHHKKKKSDPNTHIPGTYSIIILKQKLFDYNKESISRKPETPLLSATYIESNPL